MKVSRVLLKQTKTKQLPAESHPILDRSLNRPVLRMDQDPIRIAIAFICC